MMTYGHGDRRVPPEKKNGYTQKAVLEGRKIYIRTGEYEDGSLCEVFLDCHGLSETERSLINKLTVTVNLGLQYGVPLREFCDAFIGANFRPHGQVEGDETIVNAMLILDYAFRDLAITYNIPIKCDVDNSRGVNPVIGSLMDLASDPESAEIVPFKPRRHTP